MRRHRSCGDGWKTIITPRTVNSECPRGRFRKRLQLLQKYDTISERVVFSMADVDKIIREVDSSMAMEGMPLTAEDKKRIQKVLLDPASLNTVVAQLIKSRTVLANE